MWGEVRSISLLPLVARCLAIIDIYVCVKDVMDIVFSVCFVRCGAVGLMTDL